MSDVSTPFATGQLNRPGHQFGVDTNTVNPLHLEEYGGAVESQIVKSSQMRQFLNVKSVRGTDTVTNDRIGKTSLQAVTPGVRPVPGQAQFDNISLKVDTIIMARDNFHLLDSFQSHYDVRAELGKDHGKEIGKFFDEAILIQGVKAASIVAGDGTGGTVKLLPGWNGGSQVNLAAAGDENDPDLLQRALEDMITAIKLKDVDIEEAILFVNPTQYITLVRNDKLVNAEFSMGNGNYAKGKILETMGVRVMETNRLPQAAITGHKLSNAGNNNAYDVSDVESDVVALLLMPKALLAGETIPLTSDVYYSKIEVQWFVDSYLAFGATPNRAEHTGIVRKFRA